MGLGDSKDVSIGNGYKETIYVKYDIEKKFVRLCEFSMKGGVNVAGVGVEAGGSLKEQYDWVKIESQFSPIQPNTWLRKPVTDNHAYLTIITKDGHCIVNAWHVNKLNNFVVTEYRVLMKADDKNPLQIHKDEIKFYQIKENPTSSNRVKNTLDQQGARDEPDNPSSIGGGDLDPSGVGPGQGGGMIFDPLRGKDTTSVPASSLPPGALPPGARFDPFGPPGIYRGPEEAVAQGARFDPVGAPGTYPGHRPEPQNIISGSGDVHAVIESPVTPAQESQRAVSNRAELSTLDSQVSMDAIPGDSLPMVQDESASTAISDRMANLSITTEAKPKVRPVKGDFVVFYSEKDEEIGKQFLIDFNVDLPDHEVRGDLFPYIDPNLTVNSSLESLLSDYGCVFIIITLNFKNDVAARVHGENLQANSLEHSWKRNRIVPVWTCDDNSVRPIEFSSYIGLKYYKREKDPQNYVNSLKNQLEYIRKMSSEWKRLEEEDN